MMTFREKRQMIVDMKIEQSRANLEMELAKYAAEYPDENDQDGSFLNDAYCDALEMEIHD